MKNRKLLRAAAALLLVGVVGVASVGCSFEFEQPNWVTQALCDHVFDEEEVIKEATCTEDGRVMKVCTDCGKTKITTVKATGHDVVEDEAVDATCTTPGLTAGSHCTACGEVIVKQEELYAHKDLNHDGKCDYCDLSKFEPGRYMFRQLSAGDEIIFGKWYYSYGLCIHFTEEQIIAINDFYDISSNPVIAGCITFEPGLSTVEHWNANGHGVVSITSLTKILDDETGIYFLPVGVSIDDSETETCICTLTKGILSESEYPCYEVIFAPGYDW